MIYTLSITTPASTPKSSPQKTTLRVTKGLVYQFELEFPPGPVGLLGVAVFDGNYQVWPSSRGEWFASDAYTISFPDLYLKEAEPFQFDIYTYNEDDTYAHWCQVRLGMVSKEEYIARFMPTVGFDYFANLLRELERQQEERFAAVRETPFPWIEREERAVEE